MLNDSKRELEKAEFIKKLAKEIAEEISEKIRNISLGYDIELVKRKNLISV